MEKGEDVFNENYEWIYRLCFYSLKDKGVIEDCVQEALFQIIKATPSFKGESQFKTWAFVIVKRTISRFRRKEWLNSLFKKDGIELDTLSNSESNAEVESLEEARNLRKSVGSLPEKMRLAICLYYFEDKSIEDVALILGCSAGAVKAHLFKGRERLKSMNLKSIDFNNED